jgi:hypothetical protein
MQVRKKIHFLKPLWSYNPHKGSDKSLLKTGKGQKCHPQTS